MDWGAPVSQQKVDSIDWGAPVSKTDSSSVMDWGAPVSGKLDDDMPSFSVMSSDSGSDSDSSDEGGLVMKKVKTKQTLFT